MHRTPVFLIGVVLVIALSFAFELVREAPPSRIVIATGDRLGGYYRMGQRLAQRLARHGIEVEILETTGSVENLKLLTTEGGADVAFVQGGARPPSSADVSTLRTLASMDLEPIWIFSRAGSEPIKTIDDLESRRIIGGLEGSGTRDLLMRLFEAFDAKSLEPPISLSNAQAADAWLTGHGEVLFSVALLDDNPWLKHLFADTQTNFVELDDAEALVRHLTFMSEINVPRSSLSLRARIPRRDMKLLATTTNLVVRDPSHSAIKGIILQELAAVHSGTRSLGTFGKFPNIDFYDLPPDDEAVRFFKVGNSLFREHLPYWLATLVERFYAIILPILALVLPLSRYVPRWLAERRGHLVEAWFTKIKSADEAVERARNDFRSLKEALAHVDELQSELRQTPTKVLSAESHLKIRGAVQSVERRGLDYLERLESAPNTRQSSNAAQPAHHDDASRLNGQTYSIAKRVSLSRKLEPESDDRDHDMRAQLSASDLDDDTLRDESTAQASEQAAKVRSSNGFSPTVSSSIETIRLHPPGTRIKT